jgi:glycosyltransferase involved in cell wall biosynthesis
LIVSEEATQALTLLVAIPCLNEEQTVARVVEAIPREIPGIASVQVLVIDDGSTDATAAKALEAGAEVHSHPRTLGLGVSFRNAAEIAISRGVDIFVNIDGDGQFDPTDLPTLVLPIIAGQAHMVTASRFMDPKLTPKMPAIKRWGNRRVAGIVALLTGQRFHDVSCGFRALSRETLLRLNLFGSFTYTQECFMDCVFKNLTILEVPVAVRGVREFGTSRVAASIPRYAVRSLQIMLRAFISYRPFTLFTALAAISLVAGLGFLGFLGLHYWATGKFSPHIWSGFVGGSFTFFGLGTLVVGLIGDMLVRIRLNQENMLYVLRTAAWNKARSGVPPEGLAGDRPTS